MAIPLSLDISKRSVSGNIVVLRQADMGYPINITVKDNNEVFDLTGATIRFLGTTANNKLSSGNAKITNAKEGLFDYVFTEENAGENGTYNLAYFEIRKDGKVFTTEDFTISVLLNADLSAEEVEKINSVFAELQTKMQQIFDEFIEEKENEYSQLEGKYTDFINSIPEKESLINGYVASVESLADFKMQALENLADAKKQEIETLLLDLKKLFDEFIIDRKNDFDAFIESLNDLVNTKINELEGKFDGIDTSISNLETVLASLNNTVTTTKNEIEAKLAKLKQDVEQGVTPNATKNTFGTVKIGDSLATNETGGLEVDETFVANDSNFDALLKLLNITNVKNKKAISDNEYKNSEIVNFFGNYVETIGSGAFENSQLLERVILSRVKSIEFATFRDCINLISIEIPQVSLVGKSAFVGCTSLASIELPMVTSIDNYSFNGCSSLTNVDSPLTTMVGHSAFQNCTSLASIELPMTTMLGISAFQNCKSLASIELPAVVSLDRLSFNGCSSLTKIDLPVTTKVGNGAFQNCTSLASIELPMVTSIGTSAFSGCSTLVSALLKEVAQVPILSDANAFTNTPIAKGTGFIYVPDNLVESFKTATNWSTYADAIKPISEYIE